MTILTDYQSDRHNAVNPFVVVKAMRSQYCGWLMVVHDSFRLKRDAVAEANGLVRSRHAVYCRVEKWTEENGGEVVLGEVGVNPGIDAGVSVQRVMWAG